MRLLVQRVLEAAVTVDGQTTGAIGKGLLVMTGFGDEDGPDFHHSPVFEGMARKLLDLRIFPGEGDRCDKFDRSARDCGADVLLVPQFTLYADCRKGPIIVSYLTVMPAILPGPARCSTVSPEKSARKAAAPCLRACSARTCASTLSTGAP